MKKRITRRRKSTQQGELRQSVREQRMATRRKILGFRVNVAYGITVLSCVALILRLGYLQISEGVTMRSLAATEAIQTVPVLPARGRIYDANGNLLAYDQPAYSVFFTRIQNVNDSPSDILQMARVLAPAFKVSVKAVQALMTANPQDATVKLFTNISNAQLSTISENRSLLPGIDVQIDGQRKYPFGDLAGQVLGYTSPITSENRGYYVDKKHYLLTQTVGAAGLESVYEQYLQGQVGYQVEQVNTQNNTTSDLSFDPAPVSGDNLRLTLDGRLQADAQNAVMQAIKQYESQQHVQITDGAAVMIDVKTGGVLAMVSYPYLDPNWYVNGDFSKHYHYLSTSGAQMNNVIQNPNYPGSTVKPANLITGLQNGVISPSTVFYDTTGPLWIGNYPMKEDASYGAVNDVRAIGVSDDKFFYQLGLNLGGWLGSSGSSGGYPVGGNMQHWRDTSFIKGILKIAQGEMRFGLGALTGIDLPSEGTGAFYIEDQRYNPSRTTQININTIAKTLGTSGSYTNYGSPLDLAMMAFGQSQQFTPMELAQYVSTIANDGVKLQPHLLDEVLPPGMYQSLTGVKQKPIKQFKPVVQARLDINKTYLKLAQEGMYAACNSPDGTAYPTFHTALYKAAGKTGTAEIVMHNQPINNSVFIGYAPFNNPQVAVAVMVPGAGWGATTAVPIAKAMMDDYFAEHHASFMPKSSWQRTTIPTNWLNSPAYKEPEQTN